MTASSESCITEMRNPTDVDLVFQRDISFFEPYLDYHLKQTLKIGGEAYVCKDSEGTVSGLFLYDDYENTGTIFTRSREVFDYFYKLKPFDCLFAELKMEQECEPYDIFTIDLENFPLVHRFSHEISVVEDEVKGEVEQFMVSAYPRMNRRWVGVALEDGDMCFTVRLGQEIAGLGWLSLVKRIGRLHSLYVKPQFRNLGIGQDILFARLLWARSKRARSAFSEISRYNVPSSRIAAKGQMRVYGQVYQYSRKDPGGREGTGKLASAPRF